ncbi:hypothetical protein [Bradyrhizobium sp. CB3481]|uniref:hypothetical protein n=1 Tax=Bradyrhizobium sp. CB3481 TaxID=3039158 RepID=UPI0024B07251|nr:hypothetical protein [Bradyrhizobium sp. CB3481]WFU16346.1 hypothetical protein QA643_36300 [Bradyrhizobium sp. CB3481]
MRSIGTANFHGLFLRIAVVIAAASLFLASIASASEMDDLTQNMPRAFSGEFRWDGDGIVQNVVITFDSVRALDSQSAEAQGCGTYEVGREVTKIKVRMLVRLPDLQVEIFELSPEGSAAFVTDGSHRGRLSKDLQQIDAQWTTTTTGQRGHLEMRALPAAACAPAGTV